MSTLSQIFDKRKITLYQNESLDLDHYFQEPYQDEDDEIKEMDVPFETDQSKKKRSIDLSNEDRTYTAFSYFMDGSRRTYKIGDIVLEGKKIFPVVVAQVCAGCTERDNHRRLHSFGGIRRKNLLLLSDKTNDYDFLEIRKRILNTKTACDLNLDVIKYRFDPARHGVPVNAAIAKANAVMHDLEIGILGNMVTSKALSTGRMLMVDGPLQFIGQDTGKPEFADLFYDVAGVSKSFNPMLPTSSKAKREGTQIGAELLKLNYGERTPVFLKENSRRRKFGCWYLRIRPINRMSNPLEGIIKVEKMANPDDLDEEHGRYGLETSVVDTISLSLINEGAPTCYGRDKRWANHLYPVYLTETLVKSSFESDLVFISNFKRDFR